jgi:hypothetical protein
MSTLRDTAEQTISRILGEAAFIFTDTIDEKSRPSVDSWDADGVSLTFVGPTSGEIRMWVGKGFACYAAANMLGIDESSEDAQKKGLDALKELLNMIVGNFITAAWGEAPVFNLGIPKNIERELLSKDYLNPYTIWLQAEANPVLFTIEIKQDAPDNAKR